MDEKHQSGCRQFISLSEFMTLSAEIYYQLSPENPDPLAVLSKMFGNKTILYEDTLIRAVELLLYAYSGRYRMLGPNAEIHPIRTAALLCRCMDPPGILDLLGALLHDLEEDLIEADLGSARWSEIQNYLESTRKTIDKNHQWYLGERIPLYKRNENDPYYIYLNSILDKAPSRKDLLHVKLADRLDNTLDTHIYLPRVSEYNFFRYVFDVLYLKTFKGIKIREYHNLPSQKQGVKLLSQLFKNAIFLSLVRQRNLDNLDYSTSCLFKGLAVASMQEAQWIALELFSSGAISMDKQRDLLLEIMEYCYDGGIYEIRSPKSEEFMDGIFLDRYAVENPTMRKDRLAELYLAKDKLALVLVSFIATFSGFLNDPDFYIQGIEPQGIDVAHKTPQDN